MNIVFRGIQLEIVYEFIKGREGKWTLDNGDPGYPDDPDELYIDSIYVGGVNIFDLFTEKQIQEIEEQILNKL